MKTRLMPLVLSFLKLGFTAFGGPAAAYGMMRQEFVVKKKWVTEEAFLDFLGVANLVPGPNATELAILIGFTHAGWAGMILAGVCYILPAMLTVLVFAWAYVQFGSLPQLEGMLYGIKPVVVAIIISAMWGMLKPRLKDTPGLGIVLGVFVAYILGVNPILLLLGGGVVMGLIKYGQRLGNVMPLFLVWLYEPIRLLQEATHATPFSLARLFWVFLKAGALMFGSGYVLLAFIHDDLVLGLGWLTEGQLVDAIAIGQVTPGPLSTTATFVGYLLGGIPAAILATVAMFLPSFIFVGLIYFFVTKLRESEQFAGLIDGINFAALGLMAGVTWEIAGAALVDPVSFGIALAALLLLLRYELGAPWLILGGAAVGMVRLLLVG
ncbi:MAG: chromate efflux transporter [Brevefilum sp.]|nr:chromate efflux transporter [Brevefilum sp.]